MINQVVLVGRLTKDPELRMTQNGTKVCSFNLAVNRKTQVQGQPDADFADSSPGGCEAFPLEKSGQGSNLIAIFS